MGSSYYITYGGNRLTFPGTTGSVAWESPMEGRNFWVTSDNPNVYVTGTVYDNNGNAITSLTANGNSASANVPSNAVSARMTASAADYYATLFNGDGGSGFTQDWIRNGRYGSGTVQYSGNTLVLGSHSGQTNKFTASGDFATDVTARYGWFVPARINYLHKGLGNYGGDVSANKAYNRKIRTAAGREGSYPVTQNGLWGTFSSVSGYVHQVGSSYRRQSWGNFNYSMRQGGPYYWLTGSYGAGAYNSLSWATTTQNKTFKSAGPWTQGTAIETGNNNTLHIDAWYDNNAIYTVTTGTWIITGIAK
jgi:hypothetical protein